MEVIEPLVGNSNDPRGVVKSSNGLCSKREGDILFIIRVSNNGESQSHVKSLPSAVHGAVVKHLAHLIELEILKSVRRLGRQPTRGVDQANDLGHCKVGHF